MEDLDGWDEVAAAYADRFGRDWTPSRSIATEMVYQAAASNPEISFEVGDVCNLVKPIWRLRAVTVVAGSRAMGAE